MNIIQYDIHLPIDEQPSRFWRWLPWATPLASIVLILTGVLFL